MKTMLKITKALADKGRLQVLSQLMENQELCACHIVDMLGFSPATISKHMGILCDSGLVEARKEGRWVYYSLSDSMPELLKKWLVDEFSKKSFCNQAQKEKPKCQKC